MNIEEIQEKLKSLGMKEAEVTTAIKEVTDLIFKRSFADYIQKMDEAQREKIKGLSGNELSSYIGEHKDEFPPLNLEDFAIAGKKIWEDYFQAME